MRRMVNPVRHAVVSRSRRRLLLAAIAGLLLVAHPALASNPPALSGTIVSGVLTTSPAIPCQIQADCAPWLTSGCPAALAGHHQVAWLTAIVDVSAFADGTTPRTMTVRRGSPAGRILGGAFVQFWRGDCTEVRSASWHSFWDCGTQPNPYRPGQPRPCQKTGRHTVLGWESVSTTLTVPSGVRWMTVSANDNLNIGWQLA